MALSNVEIHNFLTRYAPHTFHGVFSYDQFDTDECPFYPISIVINAYPSSVKMGHWSAIYIDGDRNGVFFDSYGLRPWGKFSSFLKRHSKKTFFSKDILQKNKISCGHHCLFFICQMSKGRHLEDVLMLYKTHTFSSSDRMVQTYVATRQQCVERY